MHIKQISFRQTRLFSIPTFHYSNTPPHSFTPQPIICDLAQTTRFSMLE